MLLVKELSVKGERIFITGGAGFIGSRLGRALTALGAEVTVYDNLHPQVHGDNPDINFPMRLIKGDIRDREFLAQAIHDVLPTVVIHLAAETGTGQSADEPSRYCDVNVVGTAYLIEILRAMQCPPRRFILAATRAVYGEGAYIDAMERMAIASPRKTEAMARGLFDITDEQGKLLTAIATPENMPPAPSSVYGSTKLMQEYLIQQTPAPWEYIILRLQNVYGPGQSLRNPYTGVLSIFCQQALAGKTLNIYEDGAIIRDFVFIDDVVSAFVSACQVATANGEIINIGTGQRASIADAAQLILTKLELTDQAYKITGEFRAGDIRHALADISLAQNFLQWSPKMSFENGIQALVDWAKSG